VREETIQITTVNNGRNDVRLLSSTGMFVKTLPVVSRCADPKKITPAQFATDIQKQFLTTQDYDFYPFTTLVDKKGIHPEIMYVYEGGIDLSGNAGPDALSAEQIPLALNTAKVPLTLLVFEDKNKNFELVLEYDTSHYGIDDMTVLLRMTASLSSSLVNAGCLTDGMMSDAPALAKLDTLRYGRTCDIPYKSMHGQMEICADKTPDVTALVACDRKLTYRQFDNECNRIANALIKKGVRHGDRIVILLPRKASLITAIYGTMKTGSAYIPCDPDYPAERIKLITEDSNARYIITTADRVPLFENAIDVEELLSETNENRPNVEVFPEDVAYMIYTSGSTGRPKGVMIPQRAICNYLFGYYD
ncbi:MAG: AMP-binding protein, partial [Bacteroidales bacterium]|nr:AMP-binding protein [Bacteroidales bacterium]